MMQANKRFAGFSAADTTPKQHRQDVAEVAAYLAKHPKATTWDISMCCNMGNKQARIAKREILGIHDRKI